ncbi:zinc finger DNA-binding protein [Paraphaeosphaeria sporulosa]
MAVQQESIPSPPALPERVRYFIERSPGNMLIPLIPVDQLPFRLLGVPTQLSKQQISDETWQRVSGVTETATLLPAELSMPQGTLTLTPTPPTYRAPDYNVKKHVDVQQSEEDSVPSSCPASLHTTTSVEQPETKYQRYSTRKDEGTDAQLNPVSLGTKPSWMAQQSRVMSTGTHGDKSRETMFQAPTNKHVIPLPSDPLPDTNENVAARDASNSIDSEAFRKTHRPLYSRTDQGIFVNDNNGDRLWHPGPRVSPVRPIYPPKTHCNHWIQYGECAYGGRCLYKHEMPTLDVLKKVTGFTKIPRWYKEQTAIQIHMPGPREFPDPSTLTSMRRERDDVEKQNVPTNRVVPTLIDLDPPASLVDPVDTEEPASAVAQVLAPATTLTETEKKSVALTVLRRNSQISLYSGTTNGSQASMQRSKPKYSFKKAKQNSALQPKLGLAASRYAPESEYVALSSCRTNEEAYWRRHNTNPTCGEGSSAGNAGTDQRAAVETSLL